MHIQGQKRHLAINTLESSLFREGFSLYEVAILTREDYNSLDFTVTLFSNRKDTPLANVIHWEGPMQAG